MDRVDKQKVMEELRPHFLFNEMNIIRYMIGKNPKVADRMVYDLSKFLRYKFEVIALEGAIPAKEEWKAVEAYLRLEQVSYPNLEYEANWEVTPSICRGALLNTVELLIKEQIRETKETRTVFIEGHNKGIVITVRETDMVYRIPCCERVDGDI